MLSLEGADHSDGREVCAAESVRSAADEPEGSPTGSSTPVQSMSMLFGNAELLAFLSVIFMYYAIVQLAFQFNGPETALVLSVFWIPFFAATIGKGHGGAVGSTNREGDPTGGTARSISEARPFQFALSDLLCAVFVVAVLMGIWAVLNQEQTRGRDYVALCDFLCGSILAVAVALLASSWRTRSKPGLAVGLPIALGMVGQLLWREVVADYVLLAWCLCGISFVCVPRWYAFPLRDHDGGDGVIRAVDPR